MPGTIVYIDGFNFYYGAVKDSPYRWLDLQAMCESLLRGHHLSAVKYFTARVNDRPDDPHQSQRQDTYLRALEAHSIVEPFYGQFRTRPKSVPLVKKRPNGKQKMVKAMITEEKGSDVNLGSHLVWDAAHSLMTCAFVISNDSDLQTPIDMACELKVKVIVANPHEHNNQNHHLHGMERRKLRKAHLVNNQLPDPVLTARGGSIHKPPAWS